MTFFPFPWGLRGFTSGPRITNMTKGVIAVNVLLKIFITKRAPLCSLFCTKIGPADRQILFKIQVS